MTTDKQIAANIQNAQLSSGPVTSDGKEISKMNALKHGLLSKETLLENEDEKTLSDFEEKIRKEIKPIGELELLLTDKIITYVWRLRRVLTVEKAMMEYEYNSTVLFEQDQKQRNRKVLKSMVTNDDMEKLTRYETSVVRNFYKALHELLRLQSTRRGEKVPLPMAVDIDVDKE